MKIIRKLHFYLGVLFAPTIVFFALSGALQILGMHEGKDASPIAAEMALIHKDQILHAPQRPPRPPPKADDAKPEQPKVEQPRPEPPHRSYPLVVWFLALALSLIVSTCLGIYMAFAYKRDRVVILSLLGAGIALPIVFAFL